MTRVASSAEEGEYDYTWGETSKRLTKEERGIRTHEPTETDGRARTRTWRDVSVAIFGNVLR